MNLSDRIERKALLKSPRARIWKALTDAETFGDWFGIALKGQRFVAGQSIKANITYPGYEHVVWHAKIEQLDPQTTFAFTWHPYAVDNAVDYSLESPTRVMFTLEDHAEGILLRVVESGFDGIPQARRQEAYKMNSRGWEQQMHNLEQHLKKATE